MIEKSRERRNSAANDCNVPLNNRVSEKVVESKEQQGEMSENIVDLEFERTYRTFICFLTSPLVKLKLRAQDL